MSIPSHAKSWVCQERTARATALRGNSGLIYPLNTSKVKGTGSDPKNSKRVGEEAPGGQRPGGAGLARRWDFFPVMMGSPVGMSAEGAEMTNSLD